METPCFLLEQAVNNMSTIAIQSLTIKKLLIALAVCFAFYLSVFNTTADAAAPVVQSITPTSFASSTTSHNVNIPAASAGDIILVLIGFDVNYSITTPNGWTQLFTVANGGWSSMAAYYKPIVGDASATTVDFVSSTNTTMGAQAYRITGGNTLSAGTPVVYGSLVNQPDPPSLSPGWGVVDTLWIAVANQNQSSTITSVPTNYANGTTTNGAAGGIIHSARRSTTASSENPGVWTFSGSWESLANTIAVYNANTAPSITSGPSSAYIGSGTTRTGPNNAWQLIFNATDAEQTGSNALTFYLHTGANRTGTQVCSATFTSGGGVGYSGCAYNAPGMVVGTNTLYLSVYDGTNYAATNPTVTVLRDDTAPTASTTISTTPSPVTGNYTVTFTPNDATSTGANEMSYQIRTAAAGGGTLLTSGTANSTSGSPKTTGSITTDTLSQGSNTRYIRACDGASNCTDTSFTVTGALPPTSVTAVAYDPPALYSFKNTLKGSANPNGSPARGHFRLYTSAPDCTQDTNGTRVPSSAGNDPVLGAGSSPVAFSYTTTVPLVRQTPYWYCAYSDNDAAGTGSPGTAAAAGYQTFTTPDGPAGGCDPATAGDLTITDACTFPATDFDGVDSGGSGTSNTARITLGAGGNVTILAGQKVARGSISFSGGLLTLQNGNGGIIRGGVYLLDADGDGYIDNNTSRYVGIAPPAGYVRRNYLASTTYSGSNYDYASKMYAVNTFDCNTSSQIEGVNVANLAIDADNDGYYTGSTGTSCVGGTSTINGRTYYRVADGSYSKIIGSPTGGANAIAGSDCNDTTGEPCKPTINTVGSATQTSLVVTFSAGAGPSATGSALLWCDRTANASCAPNIRITGSVTSPYTHNATITCGKNYAYKVTSQNALGDSDFSADVVGSTSSCASAPSVTTSAATSVGASTAILNSTINPNGASTNVIYRYGTSNVACSSLPSTLSGPNGLTGSSPLSGATTQNTLTGLTVNTTYYFCATASNGIGGQQYGAVTNFTTVYRFYDTFTDTNGVLLTAHTPTTGTSWTKLIDVGTGGLNINTNTLRPSGAVNSAGELYTTNTLSTADQRIQVTMTTGNSGDDYNLLVGRAVDANNMYAAEFNTSQTRLYKRVTGTWTQIGQTGAGIGDGSVVVLNIKGTNVELLDDGVLRAAATDSSLSSAGSAGVGMGGIANGTGDINTQVLDNFSVSDGTTCLNWNRDADGDGYGVSSPTAACGTAGYVVNTSDCYDNSSNAKPGQASYFTGTRGGAADSVGNTGSSYDYDCNTTEDKQYSLTCVSANIPLNSPCYGSQGTACTTSGGGPACGASNAAGPFDWLCGDGVESSCFTTCTAQGQNTQGCR